MCGKHRSFNCHLEMFELDRKDGQKRVYQLQFGNKAIEQVMLGSV